MARCTASSAGGTIACSCSMTTKLGRPERVPASALAQTPRRSVRSLLQSVEREAERRAEELVGVERRRRRAFVIDVEHPARRADASVVRRALERLFEDDEP